MIGTITLNPSIDNHWMVKDLVKDDTNRASAVIETPGGKGVNVSKVVRELGGKTKAYALLGGLAGKRLQELTVPLDFPLIAVPVRGNTRINMILSDEKDDTQTRISAPGPRVEAAEIRNFIRTLCAARPKPEFWAFGGSLPPNLSPDIYAQLIRVLQADGIRCVLDTDGEALKHGLKAKPFLIKPNEYEMARLCGRKLRGLRDHAHEASLLARSGIGVVVVSLAAKGALFVTAREAFHVSTPKVPVRSHLGAGDSLIGGLLVGLARKMPLRNAAMLGVAASTSAVMREAPRLCRRGDIPGLLKRLRVHEI